MIHNNHILYLGNYAFTRKMTSAPMSCCVMFLIHNMIGPSQYQTWHRKRSSCLLYMGNPIPAHNTTPHITTQPQCCWLNTPQTTYWLADKENHPRADYKLQRFLYTNPCHLFFSHFKGEKKFRPKAVHAGNSKERVNYGRAQREAANLVLRCHQWPCDSVN